MFNLLIAIQCILALRHVSYIRLNLQKVTNITQAFYKTAMV